VACGGSFVRFGGPLVGCDDSQVGCGVSVVG
jgi:hypothetical protein